jgi:hypothetical protein
LKVGKIQDLPSKIWQTLGNTLIITIYLGPIICWSWHEKSVLSNPIICSCGNTTARPSRTSWKIGHGHSLTYPLTHPEPHPYPFTTILFPVQDFQPSLQWVGGGGGAAECGNKQAVAPLGTADAPYGKGAWPAAELTSGTSHRSARLGARPSVGAHPRGPAWELTGGGGPPLPTAERGSSLAQPGMEAWWRPVPPLPLTAGELDLQADSLTSFGQCFYFSSDLLHVASLSLQCSGCFIWMFHVDVAILHTLHVHVSSVLFGCCIFL